MRAKRINRSMVAAVSSLLWTVAAGAAAQHQHAPSPRNRASMRAPTPAKAERVLKVGKKDDVEFTVETLVGEMRLKPGRYVLQHRVVGGDHFVHFTEIDTAGMGSGAKGHPGEAKCQVEPLDRKVESTTVYTTREGEAQRVTKVLIRGENVAHVF